MKAPLPDNKTERAEALQALEESQRFRNELERRVAERTAELLTANESLKNQLTVRQRAENAPRENEEWLTAIFEASRDGIVVEKDRHIVYANKPFALMYGYNDPEEILGSHSSCFQTPADNKRMTEYGQKRLRGEPAPSIYEFKGVRKDGTEPDLEASVSAFTSAGESFIITNLRDITERKQAEEQLEKSRTQLRDLSVRLQSIREEERTRIAREIHDELGQALTGLKLDLSWLNKRLCAVENKAPLLHLMEKIAAMSKQIDGIIQQVRKISTELRPGILDELGLVAAIEWQAKEFQIRTGITCKYSSRLENISLEQDQSTAIFRIFQEILTNVARHANATRVGINIEKKVNKLVLKVKDNGRGAKKSEIYGVKSLGLLGMRERAQLLEGDVNIIGVEGRGTTVIVQIPLRA